MRQLPATLMVLAPLFYLAAEVAIFIFAVRAIGWWALGLVFVTSVIGALVVQKATRQAWVNAREAMQSGVLPEGNSGKSALTAAGGMLLIFPGFLGNVLGALLCLPFAQPLVARLGRRFIKVAPMPSNPTVIKGDVVADDDGPFEGTILPPLEQGKDQ